MRRMTRTWADAGRRVVGAGVVAVPGRGRAWWEVGDEGDEGDGDEGDDGWEGLVWSGVLCSDDDGGRL